LTKLLLVALLVLLWWRWNDVRRLLGARPAPRPVQTAAEARAVLGVAEDADADAIRAAHRRLIAAVHPDGGGSADLARRVNAARDTLLALPSRR